jgi:hypothetical protein
MLALLALLVGRILNSGIDSTPSESSSPEASAAAISTLDAYDPFGDGTESEGLLKNLADGDTQSSWSTELYTSGSFGNLKPGVGFILTTDTAANVTALELSTSTPGWSAEIYLDEEKHSTLEGWGAPSASVKSANMGTNEVELPKNSDNVILVWFTSVANDPTQNDRLSFRNTIEEVELEP